MLAIAYLHLPEQQRFSMLLSVCKSAPRAVFSVQTEPAAMAALDFKITIEGIYMASAAHARKRLSDEFTWGAASAG